VYGKRKGGQGRKGKRKGSGTPSRFRLTSSIPFVRLLRRDGSAPLERADAYGAWLKQGISDDELIAIRQHLQQERAFGGKRFQAMAEKTLGRPVSLRRPKRPRRPDIGLEGI
jgi:hypothetical protein